MNKTELFQKLKEVFRATQNFALFAFLFLATISLLQVVTNSANSLLLNGDLDPVFWSTFILSASFFAGLSYVALTYTISSITRAVKVKSRGLVFNKGVFRRNEVVPYSSIRDFEINKESYLEPLNLVSFSVDTKNGNSFEAVIEKDTAEKLKDNVYKRLSYSETS